VCAAPSMGFQAAPRTTSCGGPEPLRLSSYYMEPHQAEPRAAWQGTLLLARQSRCDTTEKSGDRPPVQFSRRVLASGGGQLARACGKFSAGFLFSVLARSP